MKWIKILGLGLCIINSFFLMACNNEVLQEAERVAKENEKLKEEQVKEDKEIQEKTSEIYESLEKPIDEVLDANELDVVRTVEKQIVEKENYEDPSEFSWKVSDMIFRFNEGQIKPEEYYEFLVQHGSKTFIEEWIPNREDGLVFLETVQIMLTADGVSAKDYTTTEVRLTRNNTEGYFYRKLTNGTDQEEFYVTTIVKEDGIWKFQDDSPSSPFIEEGE